MLLIHLILAHIGSPLAGTGDRPISWNENVREESEVCGAGAGRSLAPAPHTSLFLLASFPRDDPARLPFKGQAKGLMLRFVPTANRYPLTANFQGAGQGIMQRFTCGPDRPLPEPGAGPRPGTRTRREKGLLWRGSRAAPGCRATKGLFLTFVLVPERRRAFVQSPVKKTPAEEPPVCYIVT